MVVDESTERLLHSTSKREMGVAGRAMLSVLPMVPDHGSPSDGGTSVSMT